MLQCFHVFHSSFFFMYFEVANLNVMNREAMSVRISVKIIHFRYLFYSSYLSLTLEVIVHCLLTYIRFLTVIFNQKGHKHNENVQT